MYDMSGFAKKVKEKIEDVKDKAVDTTEKAVGREKETDYTSDTSRDPTKEYEASEPMSPAKIKEHEPTAVKRDNTSTSKPSEEDAKERLRKSGMTEGTAGSTETGDEYEQGAAGTNK
jgi:hypothetical protein